MFGSLALWLGGCATTQDQPFFSKLASRLSPARLLPPNLWPKSHGQRRWEGDEAAGPPAITIALEEQRAYFFKGEKLVGETDISSGRDGYDTPPGRYRVIQKDKDHRSTLYGEFLDAEGNVTNASADLTKQRVPSGATFRGAKMPFFLRFQDGYGLHAGHLPGHRASHGCVRLPLPMAEHFFQAATIGTPVLVTN